MHYILLAIVFVLVQALLLGRIHIYGVATPLFYVYLPMLFHRGLPRWVCLLLCFFTGVVIDMFCNTPGLAAVSLTFVGFIQPPLLELYLKREDDPAFRPSIKTLGFWKFLTYALLLVLLFCLLFFSLEAFSFNHWLIWLESVSGSLLLTLILILTVDSLRR
ncbi:MAG: rod shape-determining protein MreD [Prevotellaceae bacterium]|nr:rod shape-determining protein MreD [Prevotellaceae bacterium]MDO4932333.1 rod shape-determining protein MreD [Prevotellaceae bacterium]